MASIEINEKEHKKDKVYYLRVINNYFVIIEQINITQEQGYEYHLSTYKAVKSIKFI